MMVRMMEAREGGPLAPVYAEIRELMGLGQVPAIFRAMGEVGTDVLVQNWTAYRQTVIQGVLSRRLKEMLCLAVARAAGCGYGVALYSRSLAAQGVSPEMIASLVECGDAEHLTLQERAILQLATAGGGRALDDFAFLSLESVGLGDEEIAEAADAMVLAEAACRFANEVGLTEEDV